MHQQWDCYSAEALLSTHCYCASSDACHSTPIAPVCTACMTHSYTALQALPVRQTTSMHRRPITTTSGCVTLKKKLLEPSGRMQGGASDEDGVPLQNGICLLQREKGNDHSCKQLWNISHAVMRLLFHLHHPLPPFLFYRPPPSFSPWRPR